MYHKGGQVLLQRHNPKSQQKTEKTHNKTPILMENRRFYGLVLERSGADFKSKMKGGIILLVRPGGLAFFHSMKKEVNKWPMKK